MRLIERVAIVTGAGSGIGRAVARSFAEEGADVVAVGRRFQPLEETAAMVRAHGPRALALSADVSREHEVRRMVERTIGEFGRIDVLVTCAASVGPDLPVADMTLETWNATLGVTLTSVMLCARECLTHSMLPRRSGAIVNLASTAARRGEPRKAHFSAAKAGVVAFTQALAREVGPQGIRVNAIIPGLVATERLERHHQKIAAERGTAYERVLAEAAGGSALRRALTTDEIAAVAVFLASDQASAMTGQVVEVTGGS